mgnify:CR=1 FL=1
MKIKIGIGILVVAFSVLIYLVNRKSELPILYPSDFNPELVDASLQNEAKVHTIADFELLNQNGETITQANYENKVYVADFFFTRCPSICPVMSNNIEKLQNTFIDNTVVMFLSLSVISILLNLSTIASLIPFLST